MSVKGLSSSRKARDEQWKESAGQRRKQNTKEESKSKFLKFQDLSDQPPSWKYSKKRKRKEKEKEKKGKNWFNSNVFLLFWGREKVQSNFLPSRRIKIQFFLSSRSCSEESFYTFYCKYGQRSETREERKNPICIIVIKKVCGKEQLLQVRERKRGRGGFIKFRGIHRDSRLLNFRRTNEPPKESAAVVSPASGELPLWKVHPRIGSLSSRP